MRQAIMDNFYYHDIFLSGKYLGMPSDVGTLVNGAFKYLGD
jgi:hypothetical protein